MNIRKTVDRMGELKAQIAPLLEEYNQLKDELADLASGVYSGHRYDVRVTRGDRGSIDIAKLHLLLTDGQIALVSRETRVTSVTVYARLLASKAA